MKDLEDPKALIDLKHRPWKVGGGGLESLADMYHLSKVSDLLYDRPESPIFVNSVWEYLIAFHFD